MNHLIAEIKSKGKGNKTFKIFSNEEIYSLPLDLSNPKTYDSDYKLEDDEWFHIPNFLQTVYCIDLIKKDFISTDYDQISTEQLKSLKYLCSYQLHNENEYYYFQKVSNASIINKKWFKFSDTPILETEAPIVIINSLPDAIYHKVGDILYFKKLASISGIFNGISELYKEATQEETEEFLSNDFICLNEDYNAQKVGTANRKRIAQAMESLNSFSPNEKSQIFTYIKDYCSNLSFSEENSNFTITNEEELKHLLWGIEQRYYTTPIGQEKRIANSVSKVEY